jgi:hypothetical protein
MARLVLAGAMVLGACSGGSGSADPSTTIVKPPSSLPVSPAGKGTIAVAASIYPFAVTACPPPTQPDPQTTARVVFALTGAGTTDKGIAFTVLVTRTETPGDQLTTSDEILYQDSARIYQAQRVESGGMLTDIRDPKAAGPLLQIAGGHVTAKGQMGPPGDASLGTLPVVLDGGCP